MQVPRHARLHRKSGQSTQEDSISLTSKALTLKTGSSSSWLSLPTDSRRTAMALEAATLKLVTTGKEMSGNDTPREQDHPCTSTSHTTKPTSASNMRLGFRFCSHESVQAPIVAVFGSYGAACARKYRMGVRKMHVHHPSSHLEGLVSISTSFNEHKQRADGTHARGDLMLTCWTYQ